ncbi:MAG TPA: hypothetical protein VJ691_08230 [Vicinamibacterales bacterium]|nr:hypothetical protein [Vicinamibacterales bacterium]
MKERYARMAVAAIFFLYALSIRVYDIADTFLMLGEQTRDWTIALGGITELPLTGAPSTAGGRGFGPAYYWILWLGRVIAGPFADYLPHAGGFWVALLQSAADTWLLVVLWQRVGPFLALAMCLTLSSAPFDIAISSVIWNPPVAAALIKMATAMTLSLGDAPPRWKVGVTALLAWMAVQAHLSAVFVAAPLLLVVAATDRQIRRARNFAVIAGVILVLQIPYFINAITSPEAAFGPTVALRTAGNISAFSVDRSYEAVVNITGEVLTRRVIPWHLQIPTLLAGIITAVRWRRDAPALAVSIGGLLTATVLFASWTRGYDSYWFITLTAAMVLTYGLAIAAIPSRRAVHAAGAALLAMMAWLQPERIEQSKAFFKYPPYRTMRIASYQLAAREPVLRDIRVNFEGAHPTMDKYFIYRILGGRIDPSAPKRAFVNADGSVSIE